jgi:cytoskeletal protein RodZ
MENLTPQPNPSPIIVDKMPIVTVVKTSYHHKKRMGWILIAVAVLIVAGVVVWIVHNHKKGPLTPEQTLQALKDTSQPITATPKDRATNLKAATQRSTPVKASPIDRSTMLNALK